MRVTRAIDRFLEQMQLERDFTERSVGSYGPVLYRMCDEPPRGFGAEVQLHELEGREGTERLRRHIAFNWGTTSSGRRANVISIHHTFWGWAEDEAFIEQDPARRIRRPPRRRPDVYRPQAVDLELGYRATTLHERAAWVLAAELGLRASTIVATQWRHIDLTHGRISVRVKGGHRDSLPVSPIGLDRLRDVYRQLEPEGDDHVFTVEHQRFAGNRRLVYRRDPKRPASKKALWSMVKRVCKRAGIREFGPHALRHGFATQFLRDSDRDVVSLQELMGHSQLETTMGYVDQLRLDDLDDALRRASERRTSVAKPGDETSGDSATGPNVSSGPGWNRTTAPGPSADDPDRPRANDAPQPPLTDPKEGHE